MAVQCVEILQMHRYLVDLSNFNRNNSRNLFIPKYNFQHSNSLDEKKMI